MLDHSSSNEGRQRKWNIEMTDTRKELLLVVGAGASAELLLPTGQALRSQIASLLDYRYERGRLAQSGDATILRAFEIAAKAHGGGIERYVASSRRISDAMPLAISIDNFLDAHQGSADTELCGKLAITRAILSAERNSLLYFGPNSRRSGMDFSKTDKTWLNHFMRLITENCTVSTIRERLKSIAIIVFNYDRCIEHFLHQAFQTYYDLSAQDAAELVKLIDIFHPYGTVGQLPWQADKDDVGFGCDVTPDILVHLSQQIKTFTEGNDPTFSDIENIRSLTSSASRVVFLGFAFHKLNLRLIFRDRSADPSAATSQQYYGTATGISKSDCAHIQFELAHINRIAHSFVELRSDLTCEKIFSEYSRALSLSNSST